MTADEKVILAAIHEVLTDMKALDPLYLDLRKLTTMTDTFAIAHGRNTRQVQAMAKALQERLHQDFGRKPHHVEGLTPAQWVLLDYGDIIVHLFLDEKRNYYELERIWLDAPRIVP